MKPHIDDTKFGSISIDGVIFDHDVIIRLDGRVEKRKKKLSKSVYGTSHRVSLEEARFLFENGAQELIIGTGQHGALELSDEAGQFLESNGCEIVACPTRMAIFTWNHSKNRCIGLFHITC